ncbi:putative Ig domain-containing protein [Pseudoxanthomonas sp. PXM02]|uniref:putative Ig domain-containing protein n=1 Tax=Pseudoxanthomonas sp. PXM02 TaxID=2769294 RepID=UPI001784B6CB|nr:putative Ig domain-containing protein [Pseudoxanthomonas sp. PXM02]MBD9477439.1 putative Ig domain-containing protein [Pseudoxanthomonas sp. PXM02]
MSAVFTGNGLGLFNTSLSQLGYGGGAGVGQGRDAQYVNVATGNLVWQGNDEHLVFRGLSVGLNRTYNSRGQLADSGADGWITGFERRVAMHSGSFNTAGSVIRRHTGDGSYQDFTYVSANNYQSAGGDGAHDTLTWTGTVWRYVEGSTRREEGYAQVSDPLLQGRLTYIRDQRSDGTTPTTWLVDYDANGRIAEIRSEDGTTAGDALVFGYDGNGRLSAIASRENGTLKSQVWYEYDVSGRLAAVVTDLTPDTVASVTTARSGDNLWNSTASANNGKLFRTQYSYEGTSLRLASVTQSDGTLVSFTYHADGRLKSLTRGDGNANDADGVGQTQTYTYGTGTTTVADSLGRSWVYAFDAAGQLTSLTAPALSGQSDVTTYQYDAAGNVTQVKTVRGATVLAQVDYAYDAAGNVTWEWDALGNAISRTWSATNQLLSVTQYSGVDPDRTGASLPTGGMTTRYVYDIQDRLRFAIDALGSVSEFTYATGGNGIGQQGSLRHYLGASYSGAYDLTSLQAWATTTQKANSTLSELSYDAWGRLSQRTDYATVDASGGGVLDAATAISRYTYDAQGLLRQQSTLRGTSRTLTGTAVAGSQQVVYAYDGMGRLMSSTVRQVGSTDTDVSTIHTSYAYLDSGQQIVTSTDTGVTRTETRNAAGRLLSVSEVGNGGGGNQTRTTLNYYDSAGQLRASEDAGGGRTYFFYDAKGRLEATVDATGAVSRSYYDGADRVVGTRRYANRLTTTAWLVSGQVVPTQVDSLGIVASNTSDRVTETNYDGAGRIATVTDGIASSAARTISTYTYDGAHRLLQVRTTDTVGTTATARLVRSFYDSAGRQIATLDAAGYLTEVQYDRAGRVQAQTRYATVSPSAQWASGTLAQLRPAANTLNDQTTRYYYDGRSNQTGVLDAQGYLTEWIFDEAGNARAERRYSNALTWASNDTLATLRSRAGSYREQRMAYNALGQVQTQTNAEGTVTRYTYDEAGRLVKTEVAQGTSEVREGHLRYNAFNELIGELSGEGALQVLPGMTEAQLDAVYAQHGVRHGYDVLGRRIESIDASGNRTWYFYDAVGRPSFTVRGVADSGNVANAQGEVTETRYNAFGQASETITYTGRINLATPGSRASAQAAISVLSYAAATDTRRQYTYTNRGQLASLLDAEGTTTEYSYDAFGQLREQIAAAGTAVAQTTQYRYDARGLQTRVIEGVGTALQRERTATYDAFGRLSTTTDARGAVRSLTYDRLGRQLAVSQTVSGRVEATTTVYDAYGQVTSQTDALGAVTTYVHDDTARSLTVTSPEGVVVSTLHNRHGQTVRVTDAVGYSEYTYNRDGQLTLTQRRASDGTLVTSQSDEYDVARGLLTATVDGSGRRTEFTYDAVGRVLRRIEDPAGTPLITQYQYDGQGRQLAVTDPSGRVVQYAYDREGRLKEVAQDPSGLNLRTQYTYDAAGRQVSVIEGAGTAAARTIQYGYDALGRRTSEVIDPGVGKLNLTIGYAYDSNDNVIRRTDANGTVTRYYYDDANRQIYSVGPLGAMTRNWYDAAGRVVATRSFVQPTNAATLTDSDTIAQLDARLTWGATDQGDYRVYDQDGRLHWSIGRNGEVRKSLYDAAGRLIGERAYAAKFYPDTTLLSKLLVGTAVPSEIAATQNDTRDQRTYRVLDAAGQARLLIDGLGNVRQMHYDAAGRLVGSIAFAQAAALTTALRTQLEAGTATQSSILAKVTPDAARDQVQYRVHDAAGRLRYTIDAIGAVRESLLDAAGNVVGERAYATPITVDATLRGKLQAGSATVAEVGGLLAASDVRNVEQYQVRDAAGRVRFTLNVLRDSSSTGTGLMTEFKYDETGRLIERIERETPISGATLDAQLPALRAGTASVTTLASWMSGTTRNTIWIYDAAGRARYTLQADTASTWTVSEQRYDAMGRVVADLAYAVTISSGTSRTVAGVAAAMTAAGGDTAAQHRVTRYVFDANGQLRFRMDDTGAVSELRYDGLGRMVESRQYPSSISPSTPASESAMTAAVNGQANVRVTQTAYDSAGQVVSVTDAAGETESYAYNGVGLRVQLTNKLGHVWTYVYDAAGRMVEQTSPAVTVATASITGTVSTSTRAIKTVITYDALGNVLSRTEDATGSQPRTTQYLYDSRGHQIRTIFPDAWQVNPATGQLVATGTAPTIEVTYDALGRAVVQKDVRGYYSYKVYDTLGRVSHEVDADGYVTTYGYNVFGEQTTLRRHAAKLNTAAIAGFTAGNALSLSQMTASAVVTDAANDRVLTTSYDRRGLKTQVIQSAITYVRTTGATASASPTTQFSYNAFGELARTSVLLDQAAGLWAHSWQYYDELGRATLSVDAEGYVTTSQYNALGELVQVREYARALSTATQAALTTTVPPAAPPAGEASIGYDRIISYTYDAMGRRASETALRRYGRADGSQGIRDVSTQWTYDAVGQVVITDLDGQQTRTSYDVLGRISAVQEAAQQRLANSAESQLLGTINVGLGTQSVYVQVSAYTAMAYDAFGNAVRVTRYANGLQSGQSAPVADAANDQVSVTMFDRQGRAVMSQDAQGQRVFMQYDAADHVVHSWYALSGNDGRDTTVHSYYSYDGAGRQLSSRTQRDGSSAPDQREAVRYNAFGEIVAKGDDDTAGATLQAQYQYDQAGNLVRSNAEGGAWRDYGYNLGGHQVRESHSVYTGSGNVTAVTRQITDRLGRTVQMVLPSHTDTVGQVNYLSQRVDRWGNVLDLVDPRGYQTTFQYNDRNQLVKQIQPLVKVVTNTETGTWQRPELSWSYDELGRLVASRDGNGNLTRYEYDNAGKQTKVIDANGSVTLTAYDALGRARITQNALGYLTFKEYDRLDRVTAHGDYLPASSGNTRTRKVLESYVLNQNGQRLQSTNAMGQTYKYDYDSRGSLIRSQTPMNVVMEYGYDLGGRRSLERYALDHKDGVDRDGETVRRNEQTWDYDYFGRLIDRNDLSGRDYNFTYDTASGQLVTETSQATNDIHDEDPLYVPDTRVLNRTTTYYANGLVKQIQEVGGGTYTYAYDQAGNRILEQALVSDSRGKTFNLRTQIVYDSHNRLQRVVQDDLATGQRAFELTYDYDAAGNRTHVVARTGYGENTLPITVLDAAPEVIGLPPARGIRTGVASEFRVRLTDLFRDPEGKPLTITAQQIVSGNATALPGWLSYSVDANTGEAVFVSSNASIAGTYSIRLTASDGTSTAAVTFNLTVGSNTAPGSNPTAPTQVPVRIGTAWIGEFNVADYFQDADVGDVLTLSLIGISPAASWLTVETNPGQVRLSGNPLAAHAGTYAVTLRATDSSGATHTRVVNLVVSQNQTPQVVSTPAEQQAGIGRQFLLELPVSSVFLDPDGDPLALSATLANGGALPPWLNLSVIEASPRILRLEGVAPGTTTDGTRLSIRLIAQDPQGASVHAQFDLVLLNNLAPVLNQPLANQTAGRNASFSYQIPVAAFSDPEGYFLSYSASGMPSGVTFNAATRTFSGTPQTLGVHVITVTASDGQGGTRSSTFTLTVTNSAPIAPTIPAQNAVGGTAWSYLVPAFSDPNSDALTYAVSGMPGWMTFNAATRTLSGTPGPVGSWSVTVTATDSAGASATRTFTVTTPNSVPTAATIPTQTLYRNVAGNVSIASFFSDVNGDTLTFTATGLPAALGISAAGVISGASTAVLGNYTVTATASDGRGGTVSRTFTLAIANSAPVAPTIQNQTVTAGTAWSYQVPEFTDPNGDGLTYTVTGMPAWMSFNPATRTLSGTAGVVGAWTISVTARDPSNLTASRSFTVSTPNDNPTAVNIPTQTLYRNISGNFSIASYFSDINGDALTFTATGLPNGLSISSAGLVSGSTGVALGSYAVTVTANDGRGGTVAKAFTLTIGNTAPTAPTINNQTATAGTGWSFLIPAFTDLNGDTLTYTVSGLPTWMSFNAANRTLNGTPGPVGSWNITVTATDTAGAAATRTFTVSTPNVAPVLATSLGNHSVGRNQGWSYQIPLGTFSDVNGDALTYSVGTLPAGISYNSATRTLSGTPSVLGNHTITVTVVDGNGGTRSTTFTLSVVNTPPVYNGGLVDRSANRAGAVNWSLPGGSFSDVNGDGLSYTVWVERPGYWQSYEPFPGELDVRWVPAQWFPGSNYSLSFSGGAITGTAWPMVLESGTSMVQGQITHDYRVKVVANDGNGGTAEGIFSLHVNELPTGHVPNQSFKSGLPWSYQIPAFSDPNGDSLTYSVTGLPSGLSFNAGNRTISGTAATAGTYTVTVTANDGQGGVTAVSFTMTVQANTAPTAPSVSNQSATVGALFSYTVPSFTDPNGDVMTYTASGVPAGMAFNAGSRVISGTPSTAGTYTVTVTANDGRGGTTSVNFSITVNAAAPPNQAPYVNVAQNQTYYHFHSTNRYSVPSESFSVPVGAFVDPDNNPLTYTILQKPAWLSYSFVPGTGHVFQGVNNDSSPYNSHTIQIRATDPSGLSATLTLYVTSSYDYYDPWNPTDPMALPGGPVQMFSMASTPMEKSGTVSPASAMMQTTSTPTARTESSWYAYDKLNRVAVVNGDLDANGQVVISQYRNSHGFAYDAAGNQVARLQWSNGELTAIQQDYNLRGQLMLEHDQRLASAGPNGLPLWGGLGAVESRTYDEAGRVTEVRRAYPRDSWQWIRYADGSWFETNVGGWLKSIERTTYDADGRVLTVETKSRREYSSAQGQISQHQPLPEQEMEEAYLTELTKVSYTGSAELGYDAAGRVKGYSYLSRMAGSGGNYEHTYTYKYEGAGGYLEKTVAGVSDNTNYKSTTSTMTYDGAGRQIEISEHTNGITMDDRVRTFTYNGDGMIITRRDGTVTSSNVFQQRFNNAPATGTRLGQMNLRNVYANGQHVAGLDEAGRIDVLSRLTGFSNTGSGKTQIVAQAGDTPRTIAQRVYGNGNLWYLVAEANGLDNSPDGALVAGTSLTVPEAKTSSNDANTFKPYNPGEITGPTTPGLPYIEPPDKGCGTLGMIIMLVVIIVVSYFTAGAATAAMTSAAQAGGATMLASTATVTTVAGVTTTTASLTALGTAVSVAAGAAAGAAAGMAVGSAMGVASFSWRNVAQAGVSSLLTAGLANTSFMQGAMSLAGNSQFLRGAITEFASQVTSYAASRVAGTEANFSWRQVALAAVSSGAVSKVTPRVVSAFDFPAATERGQFMMDMAGGVIGRTATMHVGRKLGLGGDIDYGRLIADAFGNTIINSLSGNHRRWAEQESELLLTGQANAVSMLDEEQEGAYTDALISALEQRANDRFQAKFDRDQASWDLKQIQQELLSNPELSQPLTREERDRMFQEQQAEMARGGAIWNRSAQENDLSAWTTHAMNKQYGAAFRQLVVMPTPGLDSAVWRYYEYEPGHEAIAAVYEHDDIPLTDATTSEVIVRRLYRAGQTALETGINFVVQPILQGADLVRVGYGVGRDAFTGRHEQVMMWSSMGRAAEMGVSTKQLLHEFNPVYQVLVAQYEIRQAYSRGDYDAVASQIGGLAAGTVLGVATGKFGGARIAPGSLQGAASGAWNAGKVTWRAGKTMLATAFDGPTMGSWRAQIGAVGDLAGIRLPSSQAAVADVANTTRSSLAHLDELTASRVTRYAEAVNSNKRWAWSEIGEGIGRADRKLIRSAAEEAGLIPKIPVDPVTGAADFSSVLIRQERLPESHWALSDRRQFGYLDRLIGGRPFGTTWHHDVVPGSMQLVPLGPHNITNHVGGRTIWSIGPR